MVDAHRFLPREPSSGDELSKILEKRKAISEGKAEVKPGNLAEGTNTVRPNPDGLPRGIRAKGAGRKVRRRMRRKAAKGKRKIQEEHTVTGPKQREGLSGSQKREMLLGLRKMGMDFVQKAKVESAAHIKDSPPPSPRSEASAVTQSPMGPLSSAAAKEAKITFPEVSERRVLSKNGKKRLIKDLNISNPKQLKRMVETQNMERGQGFKMYVISVNNKLFNGGCGSYKRTDELVDDLAVQKANMEAIVVTAIEGNHVGREDELALRELLNTFNELSVMFKVVGEKGAPGDMSKEEKIAYMERFSALREKAEKITSALPKEPVELHIAGESTMTSLMILNNSLANTMDNPEDFKIVPKRAF